MIANAWTLAWSVAPFAASPIAIVMFGRYVVRKSSAEGFAAEFVSFNADVAAIESNLPQMPVRGERAL